MNLQQLIKRVKSDTWWSEEAPAVPMFCQWMQQFVESTKYGHPHLPSIIFCFIKKDFVYEETPESQKLKVWHYLWQQYVRHPSLQRRRYRQWLKVVGALERHGRMFLGKHTTLSNPRLAASLTHFADLIREHWRFTWVLESADIFTTYEFAKLIQKECSELTPDEATSLAVELSAAQALSFMEQHQLGILGLARRWRTVVQRSNKLAEMPLSLKHGVASLAQRYIWLLSNYKQGKPYTSDDVWESLRYECRKKTKANIDLEVRQLKRKAKRVATKQGNLFAKHKLSRELRAACELLSFWSRWTDERKRAAVIGNWYLEAYAQEVARRLKRNIWQVKYMLIEEQVVALLGGKPLTAQRLAERRRLSLYLSYRSRGYTRNIVMVGKQAATLWNAIFSYRTHGDVRGQVASAPVARLTGTVQVVFDPHHDTFTSGRILVTTMTRPDFVPLLRRARAIITDEGGITSHAAIISRELGIPCIIGTKIATKMLRNGNLVEIDTKQGIIKVLRRK